MDLLTRLGEVSGSFDLGTYIGFIGIAVAAWAFFWPRNFKRPVYATRSFSVADVTKKRIGGLKLSFGGKEVKKFSITKVLFINKGRHALRREDLAYADPLRIEVRGSGEILEGQIIAVTNEAIRAEINCEGDARWVFSFDYLNPKDGFVIQVAHTGDHIDVVGQLIDSRPVVRRDFGQGGDSMSHFLDSLMIIPIVMLMFAGSELMSAYEDWSLERLFNSAVVMAASAVVPGGLYFYRFLPSALRRHFLS